VRSHDGGNSRFARRLRGAVPVVLVGATLIGGCGGSGKPSYCSKVSDLKQSVADLGNVKIIQNGTGAAKSAIDKVQSSATAVVDSAKKDFPDQTSALSSAVDALTNSAKQLTSSPAATLAALPTEISAMTRAVSDFSSATSSKCS
jgi:hypothetical protein